MTIVLQPVERCNALLSPLACSAFNRQEHSTKAQKIKKGCEITHPTRVVPNPGFPHRAPRVPQQRSGFSIDSHAIWSLTILVLHAQASVYICPKRTDFHSRETASQKDSSRDGGESRFSCDVNMISETEIFSTASQNERYVHK